MKCNTGLKWIKGYLKDLNKDCEVFQSLKLRKERENRLQFLCQKVLSEFFDNDAEEPTIKQGIFWKVF